VIFGLVPGELPDPGDTELTSEERDQLRRAGAHDIGREQEPLPVTGGSQAHEEGRDRVHTDELDTGRADSSYWPDLTLKEGLTLAPLAILTIAVGVYPKPILDIVQPSFERILAPFLT
jgi:hypothetical protein